MKKLILIFLTFLFVSAANAGHRYEECDSDATVWRNVAVGRDKGIKESNYLPSINLNYSNRVARNTLIRIIAKIYESSSSPEEIYLHYLDKCNAADHDEDN